MAMQKSDCDKMQDDQQGLTPRPGFTIFDMLHVLGPLGLGSGALFLLVNRFGWPIAGVAFLSVAVLAFWSLRYAIPAFVLFLHRRYHPQARIGYEAACYVLTHFRDDTQA
jgi:hypothetical protein